MKRVPRNSYYVDRTKLWAFLYLSGFSDNSSESKTLRAALRKEFNVSVTEEKRFNLKKYIQDFMDGELISLEGPVQSYEKQKKLFAEAVVRMSDEYGWKSLVLNENDIWTRDGSAAKGRFIELFSALQKEGYITIKAFSNADGVIFDVNPKLVKYIKKSRLVTAEEENHLEGLMRLTFDYTSVREIKVNGVVIARPIINSTNDSLIQLIFERRGETLTHAELIKSLHSEKLKSFNAFLNEINVKKTIRKYLFQVSKNSIQLRNNMVIKDRNDAKKLREEIRFFQKKRR